MPDREKVIKAFRTRIISDSEEFNTVEIPVGEAVQILELLKEQEPVEPTINEYGEAYCICGENVGIIPSSKKLPSIRSKYCSECGRRMKWKYD